MSRLTYQGSPKLNDFSVAQAFRGCVRTASDSDRIREPPRINNETSRKRIRANRTEMKFAVLSDPVATARGSDTPCLRLGWIKTTEPTMKNRQTCFSNPSKALAD